MERDPSGLRGEIKLTSTRLLGRPILTTAAMLSRFLRVRLTDTAQQLDELAERSLVKSGDSGKAGVPPRAMTINRLRPIEVGCLQLGLSIALDERKIG